MVNIKSTIKKAVQEIKNKEKLCNLEKEKDALIRDRIERDKTLELKALELITLFETVCFSLNSPVEKVIEITAQESIIITYNTSVYVYNNKYISEYIHVLKNKFGISVSFRMGGGEEEWCGSGDDMTYSRNPSYIQASFHIY